jgi:pimeloyl-ACP methyl ester carboxylesterase
LAALLAAALLAGAAQAQGAPSPVAVQQAWWTGYLANAKAVKLPDGRTISLYCEGKGGPVVVMDSGLGDGASSWSAVQDQIAAKTRVCTYDRAGYGRSSLGPEPRDSAALAADLAAMLKAAHVRGPYLLVGHSLASFDVRLFAFAHPSDVAGMVLVDPSADWQFAREGVIAPRMLKVVENTSTFLRNCAQVPRPAAIEKLCAASSPSWASPEIRTFNAETHGSVYYQAQLAEEQGMDKANNEELIAARMSRGVRPLGDKPLIILTRSDATSPSETPEVAAAIYKMWVTMHDEMAELSSRGVNRIVEGTRHHIQDDKPQVVIDAVSEVLDTVRKDWR